MIYFIYGEDSYRSKQKLEDIISGYQKVHKSGLNLISIDAREESFDDFYANFKIASMFAEKKLIVVKNIFAEKKFQEAFLEQLKNIQELKDIVVVYESEVPDKRTKLFKLLEKSATCQEFTYLPPALLKKWVAAEIKNNKGEIEPAALDALIDFVKNDSWQMVNEINKLCNYKKGLAITKKDVELLVKPTIENDIFKTIDALAGKNKKQALVLLHQHLDNGDAPLYLLSMVAYQFRNLLIIKNLIESQVPYAMMAKKSGLHPFVVQKSYQWCSQFSMAELKKIYQKIFQADLDIKTGKIEPETALDVLLADI